MAIDVAKAHAYGNDFLYVKTREWDDPRWPTVAREMCARHTGIGADGLIVYDTTAERPRMRLLNADGSPSEISGNGIRGLAALLTWHEMGAGREPPPEWIIDSDAGLKRLTAIAREGERFTFRADMGAPTDIAQVVIDVDGESVSAVTLRVGNPQCVVLERALDETRYRRLGPLLEHHPVFPLGTNVSFARPVSPDRVDILIWERGVGPTLASGTGACGAAVAAMSYGGCGRTVDVVSPGGVQRVVWSDSGLELTGWAQIVWVGRWLGDS
jgi:diaminopimelate epimerase